VVLAVTSGSVEPRYPTFKGIMEAKKKPIDTLTAAELGFEPDDVGTGSSGQSITGVEPIASRQAGEVIEDDGEAHLRIIGLLEEAKVI
jgi:electron transfer flavoprotein beta subunit